MAKLKALRKDEDLAAVPLDQPVLVDLEPEGSTVQIDDPDDKNEVIDGAARTAEDPGVNVLKQQLEALQRANAAADKRANDAIQRAETAERDRAAAVNSQSQTEADAVQSGLAAAQAEQAAAKVALKAAGESGDWESMAEANARIGRSASDIREFERSAALLADRKEQIKNEPQRQVQQPTTDINTAIDSNPQLLAAEREWLKVHPEAMIDPSRNKELDVAYIKATRKGLVRGAPDYFKFIEAEMGYSQPTARTEDDDDMPVQAPVSRNDRGNDGRPTNGKIMLTPEQREIAKSMNISDIEYARQVAAFDMARKADPEKYR